MRIWDLLTVIPRVHSGNPITAHDPRAHTTKWTYNGLRLDRLRSGRYDLFYTDIQLKSLIP
ncbi:MAG: hypothetical protein ACI3V0_02645 [Faecousia sp.]